MEKHEGGLRAVLHAIDRQPMVPVAAASPLDHAPLIERAPVKMPEVVRAQHETAASSLEQAADALEAEMQSQVALMRDEANSIRAMGESQAITIEAASTMIRDVNRSFREQADKLARFRAGKIGDAA